MSCWEIILDFRKKIQIHYYYKAQKTVTWLFKVKRGNNSFKNEHIKSLELGLGCLTPLSTIFQLYSGSQFYWWRKSEYPVKTTDLPQEIKL